MAFRCCRSIWMFQILTGLVVNHVFPPASSSSSGPPPASHTTCPHTTYSHTHNLLSHNLSAHNLLPHNLHTHNLSTHDLSTHNLLTHSRAVCAAGVALGDSDLHFAWQAWHLRHWAGSGGGLGSGGRRGCLRGRRGTWRHRRAFCVRGVALGDIDVQSAWQAWHLWHWAGSGGALGPRLAQRLFGWQALHLAMATSTVTLRGRRGTWRR